MNNPGEAYLNTGFASFLADRAEFSGADRDMFYELVLKLSCSLGEGHSCIQLDSAEKELVCGSRLVVAGEPGQHEDIAPLVLYNDNLYLERYFSYEHRLARQVRKLADNSFSLQVDKVTEALLFDSGADENKDQMRAAHAVLTRALIIVNGGPGTGKTTTVVKMLAMLLASDKSKLRIGLAAPTGKAAMRLGESIGKSLAHLVLPDELKAEVPRSAMTLHRLLGVRRHSSISS